ncbi:hypothetical protein Chor_015326 [Crotalus horridus]
MAAQPVPVSKQTREVVGGIPTEVVCTSFGATVLVVVTQYGKMGTLVSVEPDAVAEGISRPLWTTKVLLGKDEVFFLSRAYLTSPPRIFPDFLSPLTSLALLGVRQLP